MTAIIRFRELLPRVERFLFTAHAGPGSRTGWQGRGEGRLAVQCHDSTIRFHESGSFTLAGQAQSVPMRNVYRWECRADRISLFHERRGPDAAVHLFDLIAEGEETLINATVHQCAADAYSGKIVLRPDGFDLQWRILGPRKDERILYHYRT
ncbi:DUF6314 family protein [Salinicola peritrichatus]|uniref:DUF6314 family protein n=1 Tax=Salinicola peritrichatus TaxID=1267424 RepID=UPI0013A5F6D1|nr:DUF6314 family protein [Salinicola peritrichatus]